MITLETPCPGAGPTATMGPIAPKAGPGMTGSNILQCGASYGLYMK